MLSTAAPQKAESSAEAQYQSGSRSTTVQESEAAPGLEREKSWTEVQRKKKSGARNEGKVSVFPVFLCMYEFVETSQV
jgi:hypothetical protein